MMDGERNLYVIRTVIGVKSIQLSSSDSNFGQGHPATLGTLGRDNSQSSSHQ